MKKLILAAVMAAIGTTASAASILAQDGGYKMYRDKSTYEFKHSSGNTYKFEWVASPTYGSHALDFKIKKDGKWISLKGNKINRTHIDIKHVGDEYEPKVGGIRLAKFLGEVHYKVALTAKNGGFGQCEWDRISLSDDHRQVYFNEGRVSQSVHLNTSDKIRSSVKDALEYVTTIGPNRYAKRFYQDVAHKSCLLAKGKL